MRVFKIVVTVDTASGPAPLEYTLEARNVTEAKEKAVKHAKKIGYEGVTLGFPKRKRKRTRR